MLSAKIIPNQDSNYFVVIAIDTRLNVIKTTISEGILSESSLKENNWDTWYFSYPGRVGWDWNHQYSILPSNLPEINSQIQIFDSPSDREKYLDRKGSDYF